MPEVSDEDYAFLERVRASRLTFLEDDDETEEAESEETEEGTETEETEEGTETEETEEEPVTKPAAKKTTAKKPATKTTTTAKKPVRRTRGTAVARTAKPKTDTPPKSVHWTDKPVTWGRKKTS